ncbi:MAG: hypothetical protein HY812_00085 [Planctomycetes bacterium]|nr:hypothetical protein [Planctomycetota bacterium]
MRLDTRRAGAALGLLFLASCYHAGSVVQQAEAPRERAASYAAEKRVLIEEMERRMNEMTRRCQAEIAGIREELEQALARLRPPARLLAVERTFRGYGAAEHECFEAAIDRLVEDAVARTEALVGRPRSPEQDELIGAIEREALATAAAVGGDAQGAGYGFVSGVQEVDERAFVTLELLQGFADVPGLRDLGALRKREVLELAERFRHDLQAEELAGSAPAASAVLAPPRPDAPERVGRFLLFQTDALEGFRAREQDSLCTAVAFQNDRLPADRRYVFLQGVRVRIVRGGMVVEDLGWRLDPGTPGRDGRLLPQQDLIDPRFLASAVFVPGVNASHALFRQLCDFTVICDYKTGLIDDAAGEVIGSLSWQTQWVVSAAGHVRVLPFTAPSFDPGGEVIRDLLVRGAEAAFPAAGRQPAPGDLLSARVLPAEQAVEPLPRDLGGGRIGTLVEAAAPDRIIVKPEGRRYLLRNRLRLLTLEARLFSYIDGRHERRVLGIVHVPEDSALRDLGFRSGDVLLAVNGCDIRDFGDLWSYFVEHPRETRYEAHIMRNGANRRLTFEVQGAPGEGEEEEPFEEEITEEIAARLQLLFAGGPSGF